MSDAYESGSVPDFAALQREQVLQRLRAHARYINSIRQFMFPLSLGRLAENPAELVNPAMWFATAPPGFEAPEFPNPSPRAAGRSYASHALTFLYFFDRALQTFTKCIETYGQSAGCDDGFMIPGESSKPQFDYLFNAVKHADAWRRAGVAHIAADVATMRGLERRQTGTASRARAMAAAASAAHTSWNELFPDDTGLFSAYSAWNPPAVPGMPDPMDELVDPAAVAAALPPGVKLFDPLPIGTRSRREMRDYLKAQEQRQKLLTDYAVQSGEALAAGASALRKREHEAVTAAHMLASLNRQVKGVFPRAEAGAAARKSEAASIRADVSKALDAQVDADLTRLAAAEAHLTNMMRIAQRNPTPATIAAVEAAEAEMNEVMDRINSSYSLRGVRY